MLSINEHVSNMFGTRLFIYCLMNISLSCLRLRNLGHSPLFNIQTAKNFNIHKSHFSYFTNSILQSKYQNQISFSKTSFKNGLSTAVKLENEMQSFKRYWSRQENTDSRGFFIDCSFDKIDTKNTNGSAIISYISLSLYNCYFNSIFGSYGGAIFSVGKLSCEFCTFLRCHSTQASSIYSISETLTNVSILNSLFDQNSVSNLFGVLYIKTWGTSLIKTVNSSNSVAMNCVGFCQTSYSHVDVEFLNIEKSESCYNGCFAMDYAQSIFVYKSNFVKCKQKSNNIVTASAILMTHTGFRNVIQGSAFIDNVPEAGYIICSDEERDIELIDCCITKADRIYNDFMVTKSVKLKNACYWVIQDEVNIGQMGFTYINEKDIKKRTIPSQFDFSDSKGKNNNNLILSKSLQFSIFFSIVACFAKWVFSTYFRHNPSFKSRRTIV